MKIAKAIGAVNTIVNRNGSLYGYNTDMPGFLYMVKKHGIDMEGKKVVVLGNGGASQAIRAGVKKMNPAKMIVVGNRTIKEGVLTYEQCFVLHSDADIVVNTSPVGMYPNVNFSPVDLTHFPQCQAVIDIIANPAYHETCRTSKRTWHEGYHRTGNADCTGKICR